MKDFDTWNREKKKLQETMPESLVFHEREIWWCSIGLNIGDEEDGKHEPFERPVLVLKKFNSRIAWVLPITNKEKSGVYYYSIRTITGISSVMLSQLRLLSTKRFRRFIRQIPHREFLELKDCICRLINGNI